MKTLSVFEGKNKFSQVIADAAKGEPQIITKNGKETAVVISIEEYRKLSAKGEKKEKNLVEILLDNPARKYGIELDFSRSREVGPPPLDFEEEI
ncbi:MAG: type II toxin-antitoxin system Phd/YefM family antitoxin [Acidobacteria bacterium]|nr:type II toxin-antitoxin system Phd/YefM family antitoxin [Acidobacteriota bacterium]